jgi:DNA-binding NtrC family response regulator
MPIPIDIRLICATNMPIDEMVVNNEFRQDLLYRINTVELRLPPLRERLEDIPLLSEHFTKMYAKKYRKEIKGITSEAISHLRQYQWPGNVRELQHAIERAVIMTENDKLDKDDFFFLLASTQELNATSTDNFNLDEIERNVIHRAIEKHSGNISKAAKELGLTRASLYRRLEKHGL